MNTPLIYWKAKTAIILLLFSMCCFHNLDAQDFWEELYFPDSVHINCLVTNNAGDIFVGVGYDNETGGVYRSTDNGQSWEVVLDNAQHGVYSIAINVDGNIYVGKNGLSPLVVSNDNGDTWEEIALPGNGNMMKILCSGSDTVYVSRWQDGGSFISFSFNGAETWDYSYITDHSNEYVSDIDITSSGEIFVSTSGYFWDQGGVYKSEDGGTSWEYVGLLNHQVLTLEINFMDDVFTGDWFVIDFNYTAGIYAHYEEMDTFNLIYDAYHVTDIVIDEEEIIYACANEGVVRSYDNGQSFEHINDELSTTLEFLHIGANGFLYGSRSHRLVKSIDPIITRVDENHYNGTNETVKVYPNPTSNCLYLEVEPVPKQAGLCEIFIFDIDGKLVYKNEKRFATDYFSIDVSHLKTGFYLVEIRKNGKRYKSDFVKN